jgi:3-dehydroquinate dehydratase-2
MRILVLNGPNLNLLGQREPEIYGTLTLDELNLQVARYGKWINEIREKSKEPIELYFYQSNHEGVLVDTIQAAPQAYRGIIYNPAAHTHYSVVLRDAIAAIPIPVVEVHLSDISQREGFRALSVMEDVCIAQFKGRGVNSYRDALDVLIRHLDAIDALKAANDTIADKNPLVVLEDGDTVMDDGIAIDDSIAIDSSTFMDGGAAIDVPVALKDDAFMLEDDVTMPEGDEVVLEDDGAAAPEGDDDGPNGQGDDAIAQG